MLCRPLDVEADFARIAAVFRASSKQQLNFPTIHARARSRIEQLIPSNPEAFARAQHAEEALDLAVTYDVPSVSVSLVLLMRMSLRSRVRYGKLCTTV